MITEGSVRGRRILEVGSGRGCDIAKLAGMGAAGYAVDFSRKALEISTSYTTEEGVTVIPVQADARSLPLPSGVFDLVYSQGLVEHYQPPDQLLVEQVRVAREGGFVLVDVPQLLSVQAPIKRLLMIGGRWPYGWERDFTEGQLKKLMRRFGLEIVTAYGWGSDPPISFGTGIRRRLGELLRWTDGERPLQQNVTSAGSVTRFQKSWLGRHCLNNIGVVGRKV